MSTDTGENPGKTAFVKEFLSTHRDAYHRTINDAWAAAGHPGTISESLVGRIRSDLGLTSRRGRNSGTEATEKPSASKGKAQSSLKSEGVKRSANSGAGSSPAEAAGSGGGGEKTAFVRKFLLREPEANPRTVNGAWNETGHEGMISETMIYNIKRDLGLTGDRTASARGKGASKPTTGATRSTPATPATGPSRPLTEGASDRSQAAAGSESVPRDDVLDRVEDGIDNLIIELKQLGGMEDALEALRKARRVVVRGLEG